MKKYFTLALFYVTNAFAGLISGPPVDFDCQNKASAVVAAYHHVYHGNANIHDQQKLFVDGNVAYAKQFRPSVGISADDRAALRLMYLKFMPVAKNIPPGFENSTTIFTVLYDFCVANK